MGAYFVVEHMLDLLEFLIGETDFTSTYFFLNSMDISLYIDE